MDEAGLTSGQVAYRMGVSDGAVRGWTTGRRGITTEDIAKFADIVGYPVGYFLYEDYELSPDFSLGQEVKRLSEQVEKLLEKVPHHLTEEQCLEYLRESLHLDNESMNAIRRILRDAKTKREL